MGLQPRAFGLLSQACKDPSHNYLHQSLPGRNLKFSKVYHLEKILVQTILFYWFGQKLVFGLQIMEQLHDSVHDVFIRHHLIKWIAKQISNLCHV